MPQKSYVSAGEMYLNLCVEWGESNFGVELMKIDPLFAKITNYAREILHFVPNDL